MRAKRNQARNSITKFKNGEKSKRKRTKKKIKIINYFLVETGEVRFGEERGKIGTDKGNSESDAFFRMDWIS
nr:MAG TPA: hypothetical protein [Bacteriophage sp.]